MVTKKADKDKGNVRVFVYGTLKTRGSNNGLLRRAGGQFLGYDCIHVDAAAFINFGSFPAMVYPIGQAGKHKQLIRGEVWYGPDEILRALDQLEGHPHFFERRKHWTMLLEKRCWVYAVKDDMIAEAQDFMEETCWKPHEEEIEFWEQYINKNSDEVASKVAESL